jgi:hypothetical protein
MVPIIYYKPARYGGQFPSIYLRKHVSKMDNVIGSACNGDYNTVDELSEK